MKSKKSLRPAVPSIESGKEFHPAESFQNEILRPILKFQNSFLLTYFRDYVKSKNTAFNELPDEKKSSWIDSAFSKDQSFKNQYRSSASLA